MLEPVRAWFQARGWRPAAFQERAWRAYLAGESGLIHSPTGSGKTLAAWLGPVAEALAEGPGTGPRVLWITPLRALAGDVAANLRRPLTDLGLPWTVETRTGDTGSALRARQRRRLPAALVTTPESLSLLLSYPGAAARFDGLRSVVVDEWHELLGGKRGVLLELALARLRATVPGLRTWGLSATLANLTEAMEVLLGVPGGRLIRAPGGPPVRVRSLLPPAVERFPWAGHLGLGMLQRVLEQLAGAGSSLVFTNTRSQAERWHEALVREGLDRLGSVGLHHGSVDRALRARVEAGLREGSLRSVVCTSSLDLGVDFQPVDRVVQVGSPKGVARLAQRAGRCGHRPGGRSEVLCVPTHTLELLEAAAARRRLAAGRVEPRRPLAGCLDVLVQHLVSSAAGDGFRPGELLAEVRSTHAFRDLDEAEWQWCLAFISRGGAVLEHYPQFRRVEPGADGVWRVTDRGIARRHRLGVGTITSDPAVLVRFHGGACLGQVEESFISRLRPGDRFLFAGRCLELVRVRDLTASVRLAAGSRRAVPRWQGGRLPLSTELADALQEILGETAAGRHADPETRAVRPVLELQQRWSAIPGPRELLAECIRSRDGHHLFVYPFAGRLVHEGLAALLAWRLGRRRPGGFALTANDYGFELLSAQPLEPSPGELRELLSPAHLEADLAACVNAAELARRRFRDIARVAGLVFQGYPGQGRSARQLQVSSSLLFDTLERHDPEHRLLQQARREVLEGELELTRLRATLEGMTGRRLLLCRPEHLTPLAFPLWADRQRSRLSTEDWEQRVRRMAEQLERAARRGARRRA